MHARRYQPRHLDNEQKQEVGKEHVLGKQHRIVREHGHEQVEHEHRRTGDHAAFQFCERADKVGDTQRRDAELQHGIDEHADVLIVEQRDSQLNAAADKRRVHHGMVPVETHVGVDEVEIIARALGIVEPLANLRARVAHKETGHGRDKRRRPAKHDDCERNHKGMPVKDKVRKLPNAPITRFGELDEMQTHPIEAFVDQVKADMRKEIPADGRDARIDKVRMAFKNQVGTVGEVVTLPHRHHDGECCRRNHDRRANRVAPSKEHIPKRQGQKARKR